MGDLPLRKLLLPSSRLPYLAIILTLFTFFSTYHLYHDLPETPTNPDPPPPPYPVAASRSGEPPDEKAIDLIERTADYFARYPPRQPLKDQFGERGQRAIALKGWIHLAEELRGETKTRVERAVEAAAPAIFPFLAYPPNHSPMPLRSLRSRFVPGTRGIVVPAGDKNLRLACHLVSSLLHTHGTTLPIELAYAGDGDLSPANREVVVSLFPGADVRFLDVLGAFNDSTLDLARGRWAIKPFAAVASSFAEVALVDADTVFLQDPEVLFGQPGYVEQGALLFHDRLIDKGRYNDRRAWWKAQVASPSAQVEKSLAWTEGYAEEGDSGVVVVDKGRVGVLVGMLHAAWQNSREVREEVTYEITYGDKESWWFGLELTGAGYEFEKHYGGVAGWLGDKNGPLEKEGSGGGRSEELGVCSYVIAHLDAEEKLLWYNGSLLKNKIVDQETYLVPTHWMVDGEWDKGFRGEFSCMTGGLPVELTTGETEVLRRSVEGAKKVDAVVRPGQRWWFPWI
ncbi:related to alpha-1,3-mannosyltransferases [Cephalotrichum gorgonifer]|uniref:Related to alpha-1,3-mannosyltransferases n=1 Tax=Cephalotrichum gorgonifer TaxID=2041049 RepID=A0AAE8N010_9PEZI|nr:related to alpha-1,3-mannosyltransferases [Cephalotrichum gorgonifer]